MRNFLLGAVVAVFTLVVGGGIFGYLGAVDVAADSPHSALVHTMIETVRNRSIDRQARNITMPAGLADPERIRRGAGNYAAMCASCHLSPGVKNSEIRKGLYPVSPNLANATKAGDADAVGFASARRFWVIKHGIKASGMSAWGQGGMGDEAIWDLVAFLERLPSLTPSQYKSLVKASDGHSH